MVGFGTAWVDKMSGKEILLEHEILKTPPGKDDGSQSYLDNFKQVDYWIARNSWYIYQESFVHAIFTVHFDPYPCIAIHCMYPGVTTGERMVHV